MLKGFLLMRSLRVKHHRGQNRELWHTFRVTGLKRYAYLEVNVAVFQHHFIKSGVTLWQFENDVLDKGRDPQDSMPEGPERTYYLKGKKISS